MSIDKVRGTDTLTLRLTKEDKAALDELVEAERVELAARGVAVSIAQYVRGLIRAAYAAMVARRPAPAPTAAPTPPAAPAPTEAQVRSPGPATGQGAHRARAALAGPAVSAAPAPTEAQVRRKLQASKLTQAELSRLTGIDAAMLSRFKSGKKPLSPEKLARLSDALG